MGLSQETHYGGEQMGWQVFHGEWTTASQTASLELKCLRQLASVLQWNLLFYLNEEA